MCLYDLDGLEYRKWDKHSLIVLLVGFDQKMAQ